MTGFTESVVDKAALAWLEVRDLSPVPPQRSRLSVVLPYSWGSAKIARILAIKH